MKTHIVQAGESLSVIARKYGFLDWHQLYNHEANKAFRQLRPTPSLIFPGDRIQIPDSTSARRAKPAPPAARRETEFEQFMRHLTCLEQAAIQEGHTTVKRRITDFRLIYYPNNQQARTYAGVTVGGGAFSLLIPGAATAREPLKWTQGELAASRAFLADHQVLEIRGTQVDIGHVFAGLDAGFHPTAVSLAGGVVRLASNMAAATYAGDLGSVVGQYILGAGNQPVADLASKSNPARLKTTYDGWHSPWDTAGNADAYAMVVNLCKTVAENLSDYYLATSGGVTQRYTQFMQRASLTNRSRLVDLTFNAALAYMASKGHKDQVAAVQLDPGPALFGYTLWEVYYNVTQWTVDLFLSRFRESKSRE